MDKIIKGMTFMRINSEQASKAEVIQKDHAKCWPLKTESEKVMI